MTRYWVSKKRNPYSKANSITEKLNKNTNENEKKCVFSNTDSAEDQPRMDCRNSKCKHVSKIVGDFIYYK